MRSRLKSRALASAILLLDVWPMARNSGGGRRVDKFDSRFLAIWRVLDDLDLTAMVRSIIAVAVGSPAKVAGFRAGSADGTGDPGRSTSRGPEGSGGGSAGTGRNGTDGQ